MRRSLSGKKWLNFATRILCDSSDPWVNLDMTREVSVRRFEDGKAAPMLAFHFVLY